MHQTFDLENRLPAECGTMLFDILRNRFSSCVHSPRNTSGINTQRGRERVVQAVAAGHTSNDIDNRSPRRASLLCGVSRATEGITG